MPLLMTFPDKSKHESSNRQDVIVRKFKQVKKSS